MDRTSSVVTGGVTISAATLVPLVTWVLNGMPAPIPESIPYLLSALLITVGHALYNVFFMREKPPKFPMSPGERQYGFAHPGLLLVLAVAALALSGCASLQYAGSAEYSVKPFVTDKGAVICCEVTIRNGKEITNLEAHVSKQGENYTIDLKEQGVLAFKGQEITAKLVQTMIDDAAKAAAAAALAPVVPMLGGMLLK